MNLLLLFLCAVLSLLTNSSLTQHSSAEPNALAGCDRLEKNSPPLFISFEREAEKVWANHKYQPGLVLRVNNNSNCVITLRMAAGSTEEQFVALPSDLRIRDGKLVRLPEAPIPSRSSGKIVGLYYLTHYQGEDALVEDNDFHAINSIDLNSDEHVFFGVPLKSLKRGGRILVPFNYKWYRNGNECLGDTPDCSARATEHYLNFDSKRLPKEILK
jgi:hypothetical protein